MSDLADKKCIPCDGGIPGFDITEIHKYLKMVDGWKVEADENKIIVMKASDMSPIKRFFKGNL